MATPTFEIRTIELSDAAAVCHLICEQGHRRYPADICHWIEWLHRERHCHAAFVAFEGYQLAGLIEVCIEYHLHRQPFAAIRTIFVDRRFHNRGLRRLLCARAEEWAWTQGVQAVRAAPHKLNVDYQRFYLENGFEPVRETVVFEKPRSR